MLLSWLVASKSWDYNLDMVWVRNADSAILFFEWGKFKLPLLTLATALAKLHMLTREMPDCAEKL